MKNNEVIFGKYFCGNLISEYGRKNGRVDYATFAKSFDAVLNNSIREELEAAGFYFEIENGWIDNSEAIEEAEAELEELGIVKNYTSGGITYEDEDGNEATPEQIELYQELEEKIEDLQDADTTEEEIFQWFIVSDQGAELIKDYTDELLLYCESLDLYLWGVSHWGTSWDYVLTDIPCEVDEDAKA